MKQLLSTIIMALGACVMPTMAPTASAQDQEGFTPTMVVEELTGMWWQACPYAAEGLEAMSAEFPDTFFPIAIHGGSGDIWSTSSYDALTQSNRGWPNAYVNRNPTPVDANYSSWRIYYDDLMLTKATAAVEIANVDCSDNFLTTVTVKLKVAKNYDASKLRLSCVAVENDFGYIEGAGDSTNYRQMYPWGWKQNVVFQHVALVIFPDYEFHGSRLKTTGELRPGEEYTEVMPQFYIPNRLNTHVTQRQNVELIVMLHERDGVVLNAARVKLDGDQGAGVEQVRQPAMSDNNVYNLQGARVKEPLPAGIYIKNGKKFLVR